MNDEDIVCAPAWHEKAGSTSTVTRLLSPACLHFLRCLLQPILYSQFPEFFSGVT